MAPYYLGIGELEKLRNDQVCIQTASGLSGCNVSFKCYEAFVEFLNDNLELNVTTVDAMGL